MFQFTSVRTLTLESIAFINCGIQLVSINDTRITNCTFEKNAILLVSSNNTRIRSCLFHSSSADSATVVLFFIESTGNVIIENCSFENNSAENVVGLLRSTGDITITNCTFQNNSANNSGVVWFKTFNGIISVTNCKFQNNSATFDEGTVSVKDLIGNFSITNCKFQNDANSPTVGDGGAVVLYAPSGNISITSITNCTFENYVATDYGRALSVIVPDGGNVSITNCIFHYNSGAILLDGTNLNAIITNCTFENNNDGGALKVHGYFGNVSITNCTFQNNSALSEGGALKVHGYFCNVSITNCTFQNNSALSEGGAIHASTGNAIFANCTFHYNSAGGGPGGAMLLKMLNGDVSITNCIFENNSATIDGGAMRVNGTDGIIIITNCTFQNNSASAGTGGAMSLDVRIGNFSLTDCKFQNNNAHFGGALYITSVNLIFINSSTFTNNTATKGAAIYARNSFLKTEVNQLILQDVVVQNNLCSCDSYNEARGGAIYFNRMKVDIFGNTITGSQFSSNSPQGAIQGENGFLLLHGNIAFTNNTGENGGAIGLSNNVPLYFYNSCRVKFSRNVATGFGGAIYSYIYGTQEISLEMLIFHSFSNCAINLISICAVNSKYVTFIDNHAQQGGHAIYATPIYNCINCASFCSSNCPSFICTSYTVPRVTTCPNLTRYFKISPLPEDINEIQVLSFPAYVQLCGCSDPNLCNFTSQYEGKVTTYPGRTLRLNVTSVDYGNNLSPSVVYTVINTNGTTFPNITLGPRQKAQWIGTVCGTIEYQIYGPEMAALDLFLSNNAGNYPTVIEIKLLPCEPGFSLMSNSSTGVMACECSQFFKDLNVICDVLDGTVSREKSNWIGVYNNTLPALASFCPLDYCNSTINKLSLARPGDLCNGDRTGIICGHCLGNHSVIFGSSKCQVCSGMWLITLLMFAVLGVLLVAALFFLNLTVTQGTLYGLIFYANIIQVNTSIFFNQSNMKPLQVVVSFVNLDLGLPLCFYDGMDDADKAGLQFVFPAYLLILTMLVIMVCHYCLHRSPTTSSRSYFYRFPIIIGQRAVGVLSTLIYLSYSKLLRTVIDVLTYSTVHLPTGDMYVWFYDGNVKYLSGKHTVLFVVAMVICTLFLLPYTFAITFIPIIERYSEHNRLFNYLHKKANQIKPMNDAHYAPYKGEWP